MRTARNLNPIVSNHTHDNARRHGRLKCDFLNCYHGVSKFGRVLDLSASGMRLHRKSIMNVPHDRAIELVLHWYTLRVPIKARVVWSRKIGLLRHLLGFEFIDTTPGIRSALVDISRSARMSLILAKVDCKATHIPNGLNHA